jgi:hypothetical protein
MKSVIKSVITQARLASMKAEIAYSRLPRFHSKNPRIFSLDLHTALMGDLRSGISEFEVDLVNWSLSGNNRNVRKVFKVPDPVYALRKKSWLDFTETDFLLVSEHYKDFFKKFDGFVCTFPPAFIHIFEQFNKPILIYSGTRYEAPFTNKPNSWTNLNSHITTLINSKKSIFATNNLGDSDYIKYHAGLTPELVPSICEYTNMNWDPKPEKNIIFCRSEELSGRITFETQGRFRSARDVLGNNYSYNQLSKAQSILVIPYNISTMSLFEFATAGIEILMPSKQFLRRLFDDYDGVLSELSFYQIQNLDVNHLRSNDPNNYKSDNFFDWWVSRSDFYNSSLMPNIKLIDSFEELNSHRPANSSLLKSKTMDRNDALKRQRREMLARFVELL